MPAGALALLDAVPALPTPLGAAGGVNVAAATGAFASSLAGVLAQFPVAVGDGAAAATSIDPTATVAMPDSGAHDAPAPPTLVLLSTLTLRSAPTMAPDAISGATPAPIPVTPTTAAPALLSDPGTATASATAPATQVLPVAQLRSPPPNNAGPAAAAAMQGPTAPATPPTEAAIGEPPQSVGDVSPALRSQDAPTLDTAAPQSPSAVVSLPARRMTAGEPVQAATTSPTTSVPAMPVPGAPLPVTPSPPESSATAAPATPTPAGAIPPATASGTATAATPPQPQEPPPQPSAQSQLAAPETAPAAPSVGMAASRTTAPPTKPKQSGVGAHDATAEKASAPPAEPGVATPPDATALVAILASQGGPPISPEPRRALASASGGVDAALDPPAASQGTPALAASQTVAPPRPRPLSSTDTAMASLVATDLTAPPVSNPSPVQATATVGPDPQTTSAAAPASASTTAGAAPAVTPPPHPAPAAQLAPVLLTLAGTATGSQHLTLRLQPADLGTVQVRIDRPAEAPARVEISVSRPETLTLLLRDQTQLQRSLDQAGVPPEGRSVTFQLADQGSGSSFRQPDGFAQPDAPHHAAGADTAADDAAGTDARFAAGLAAPIVWRRAGLDITA